ncbi:TonB-dependent receptor plug domain-containing protein [Chitinophaga sp. NPDC101104]|uniref:TonB-dependent receptor plug domain-containing protein n=1 Tax=Chitinophaga sp. NPDC101104 TaxID=3390561 RepID=UPI003D02AF08
MRLIIAILSICCMMAVPGHAQLTAYASVKQKVYVHFNHTFFSPGDAVFYKIYVTRGQDGRPSFLSESVQVEWFSPDGKRMVVQQFAVRDGYAEGSFHFGGNAKGGIYKVRAYTNGMRNESDSTWFSKEITVQRVVAPRILLQLDFPQKGYGPGATVNASFTARTLDDKPVFNREVQFTAMVDGRPFTSGTISTGADGKANVRFRLPDGLRSTDVLLLLQIQIDQLRESISRSVPVVLNKIDLQFLPEGGTFVNGLLSVMAFRAVDEFGKPADVRGSVTDQFGNVAATFDTYRYGMGKFSIRPVKGRRYTARLAGGMGGDTAYHLPVATDDGAVLTCWSDSLELGIQIAASQARAYQLTVHSREKLLRSYPIQPFTGLTSIAIPTDSFPAGILRIRLQTPEGAPVAERRLFVRRDRQMIVSLVPEKEKYLPRENVKVRIKTTTPDGQPLPANISLSVVDDKLWTFADDRQDNLLSWLLFSSELRGKVEEPAFYFKANEPQALPALDLVMLTHGYRYFEPVQQFRETGVQPFSFGEEHYIIGAVYSKRRVPMKCRVYLYHTQTRKWAAATVTDSLGRFIFGGVSPTEYYSAVAGPLPPDSAAFINFFHGSAFSEAKQIFVDQARAPQPVVVQQVPAPAVAPDTIGQGFVGLINNLPSSGNALNDVVVVGYGAVMRREHAGSHIVALNGTGTVPGMSLAGNLQGNVAGITVQAAANPLSGNRVFIRGAATLAGNNEPLVIINGMPASMADVQQNIADISSITVLKDNAATAIYGSRAINGVILVNSSFYPNGWKSFPLYRESAYLTEAYVRPSSNYNYAERFYTPYYGGSQYVQDDFRETIFWDPVVFTDAKGEATVTFRNSDANTTFRMIAEGIGYEGSPGRTEATYAAESRIAAELTVPKELLSGDSVMLQLHQKNNDTVPHKVKFKLEVPDKFLRTKTDTFSVTLLPGVSRVMHIPVVVTAAGSGMIVLYSESGARTKSRKGFDVEARERGFPASRSFTGQRTEKHAFSAERIVPGSLRYTAQIFRYTDEQLEEGLKAMLREPHGCFEQVSSTTHPNVLILELLGNSGHLRPGARSRAMRYLERGYRKLAAFETSEHGFDWFGHAPGNTLLTAYGLMEFTDMQRFIQVDTGLLNRTKRFLLARRDGDGCFRLKDERHFNSGIVEARDAYVVYAMAESGLGDSVLREYHTSLQQALDGRNAYITGIMALAAHRLGRTADFQRLVAKLEALPREGASPFFSGPQSLEVEIAALRTMAWSRIPDPPIQKIAREMGVIMKNKSSYGYGSTQATVMALKAIAAYSALQTDSLEGPAFLLIDGKPAVTDGKPQPLVAGKHAVEVVYPGKTDGMPYLVEATWRTLAPPSSEKTVIRLQTKLAQDTVSVGSTVRMRIEVRNTEAKEQAMTIAKIGIPGGLQLQPWQLKEWTDKQDVAYYEIFDGYLVLYWRDFRPGERKILYLDLKADFPGKYHAQAGCAGLYYVPEQKDWQAGTEISVLPAQ